MKQSERIFKTGDLEKAVKIAKEKGYKVYTFESSSKYIKQVFFEDLKKGIVGSGSAYFSGMRFSTVHKKNKVQNGTGFGSLIEGEDFNSPFDIDVCFITYPYWYNSGKIVEKYKSWEEYLKENTILNYYEL